MTQNTNQFGFKTILKGFLNAFNMERGLIPTLRDLLLRPSKVVNYYIEGNKEKYFSPGRFFVTAFAIYAIFILLFPSMMPETVLDTDSEKAKKIFKFLENNPMILYASFLIPINAIISRLAFYKHKLNLAKHFVIHIYCMSFLLIFTSLIMLPFDLLFQDELNKLVIDEMLDGDPLQLKLRMLFSLGISTLIQIIYYAFALKQIFQIKTYSAILKSLLLYLGFLVSLMLVGLSHGILNSYAAHH
jgi:hypothetical protein